MKTSTVAGQGSALAWASEPVPTPPLNSRTVIASIPANQNRPSIPSHLIAGLCQLLRTFDYATDVGGDPWDFAIESSELRHAGMTTSDFRWLVSKGFVEHGQEISRYGARHRCFHRGVGLTFLATSALVLTPRGATEIRKMLAAAAESDLLRAAAQAEVAIYWLATEPVGPQPAKVFTSHLQGDAPVTSPLHRLGKDVKPAWEVRRRELRVGEFLVKKFRVPAGNQELVLSAFEEEGWPAYIDDPLPMKCEIAPKQRLHNVVTRLNGSQLVPILRFQGDGNGEGIGWQLLPARSCR